MNIVVLGNKRVGKSSILKVVFQKISIKESLFLESTTKIEEYKVQNNNFTKCSFFDFPGNFEVCQMNSLERNYLQSENIMIYVLDAKDEPYNRTIEKFLTLMSEIYEMNPLCIFYFLIHKLDGEMFDSEDLKIGVFNEISELIRLNSAERNLPQTDILMTSIHDLTIYIALSTILQKSSPLLPLVQDLLDGFILESMIDKLYIIDIISKLFIATDSRPIDLISYELCINSIDVTIELSSLYG